MHSSFIQLIEDNARLQLGFFSLKHISKQVRILIVISQNIRFLLRFLLRFLWLLLFLSGRFLLFTMGTSEECCLLPEVIEFPFPVVLGFLPVEKDVVFNLGNFALNLSYLGISRASICVPRFLSLFRFIENIRTQVVQLSLQFQVFRDQGIRLK